MRRGRRCKKQIRLMVIGVCSILLIMTAGYAAMQTQLNISAKGNVVKKITPATEVITNLVSTNTNELYEDDKGNIRYYGTNPNNYVTFNNELWRIMGVIDGYVKIIRNEQLPMVTTDNGVTIGTSSGFYWNKVQQSGKNWNNWEGATLQTYLNGTYYNGIENTSRNMIQENTYYLGGPTTSNYNTLTASEYYDVERSGNVYSGNPTSTKQSIGLMYPSDYGYAAGSSCLTTALYSYNGGCMNSNYLHKSVSQWLQAPSVSPSDSATYLYKSGYVYYDFYNGVGDYSFAVFPVLYLKSQTEILEGDGSQGSPYELG